MTKEQIVNEIITLICETPDKTLNPADIKSTTKIIQELGLDSLDYATIMLGCEKVTGIKIQEKNINWSAIRTVGDLADVFVSCR